MIVEWWPSSNELSSSRFTTVASWSSYSDLEYRGEWYRSKYEEFQRFADLPNEVDQDFEVSLKSFRRGDRGIRLLREKGWFVSNASQIGTLSGYQRYISCSRAEIGIAQNAYVKGRSGWFSDRAAHYLASGRPVLAQATGFEEHLPIGRGLLSFETLDDAAAGVNEINRNYKSHCRAARRFAEEYLDYKKVLPKMLETCAAP